jgi:hypothetical protein
MTTKQRDTIMLKSIRRRFARWRLACWQEALTYHYESGYCHVCDAGYECRIVAEIEQRRDYWQRKAL